MLVSVAKSHFLLNLSQHCHKSVFLTSESGLFTAFLQKSYQVFFLYKLLFALFCLVLSLFISILPPDRVFLSWSIFFRLSSQICHRCRSVSEVLAHNLHISPGRVSKACVSMPNHVRTKILNLFCMVFFCILVVPLHNPFYQFPESST